MEFVLAHWKAAQLAPVNSGSADFGSVVSISGPLLTYPTLSKRSPTPLLMVHPGSGEGSLSSKDLIAFGKAFEKVTESKMKGAKGGMPASKEDWEPIMRFWSEQLQSRKAEGLYEVLTGSSSV